MANQSGSTSYPGSFQNALTDDGNFYKNQSIINQEAGFVEFFNSKGIEQLNIFHKNGSGYQFTPKQTGFVTTKKYKANFFSDKIEHIQGNYVVNIDKNYELNYLGDRTVRCGDCDKWQKHFDAIKKTLKPLHEKKKLFELKRTRLHNPVDQSLLQLKEGFLALCEIEKVKIKVQKTISPSIWTPYVYAPCFRVGAQLIDNIDDYPTLAGGGGISRDGGWFCLNCNGTAESPSSQDGKWMIEPIKKEIEQNMIALTSPLAQFEKNLAQNKHRDGGNDINKVSKDKVDIIGLAFNDMAAMRIDPHGRLIPHNLVVDPFGGSVYKIYKNAPLIERVHVDDLPGGSYTQQVGNKYNMNVGAGGISIKTSGHYEAFGVTYKVLTEQLQFHSRLGTEITSGDNIRIASPNIVLKPINFEREIEDSKGVIRMLKSNGKRKTEKEGQVLIEGNLGVEGNTVMKGGLHVEGELSIHHITAPCEYHITEEDFEFGLSTNCGSAVVGEVPCAPFIVKGPTYADIVPGCLIAMCIVGSGSSAGVWPCYSVCSPSSVLVHPHHHRFKNLPLRLVRDAEDAEVTYGAITQVKTVKPHDMVRVVGARNNSILPILAKRTQNSQTNNTVIEKFGNSNCGTPLTINNASWEEPLVADSLPKGMGISTEESQDKNIKTIEKDNDLDGIKKSKEFELRLAAISLERKNHETFYTG